ncbi:replication initiation protein [Lactococcus petauri]|uniref:replication initiation protein n=1 Tax=Lactococcus petauri TaxID=1940789 RepID=UPI001F59D16C|nr:replication initiation protein [Lactococcus petauri]
MNNKKISKAFEAISKRQEYTVFQANDLAKAFGNLTTKQHKLFDFTTSYITKDSKYTDEYTTSFPELLKHFGLTKSGASYAYIAKSFDELRDKTQLLIHQDDTLIRTGTFDYIVYDKKEETIRFNFSKYVLPYLVELKDNYYAINLSTLTLLKSKYSLILVKLWQANKFGNNPSTQIKGSLEEWKTWFFGSAEKKISAGEFKAKIITRAAEELEKKLHVEIELLTRKNGRKVTGYEMTIRETSRSGPILQEDIPFDFGEE